RARHEPPLRPAAPAGDRACARGEAPAAAPGRARRGAQPPGERRADAPDPGHPPSLPAHDPPDRARHEGGDGDLRAHRRARLRGEDRRGRAGADPLRSQGDRGLPRRGDACVSQLVVEGLDVYYGAVHALKGVSLRVEAGEIVTLIGANGAGKTTLLRTLSGIVPARSGRIAFEGKDITKLPAHEIVGLGVSQSPEGRMVFANLSVEDNLELGAYRRRDRDGIKQDREQVFHLFPRLLERRKQLSGTLSGGEQQMLAMGRALMSRPRLLLLDEPSLGIAPLLVRDIFKNIVEINAQ